MPRAALDMPPRVSIIALCYCHERFVEEALQSVIAQTYPNIELIVVDDASPDRSVAVIRSFLSDHARGDAVKTCFLSDNRGSCAAFNRGLALATGEYVIDFATDDILLPPRVEQQVAFFEQLDETYGVVFSEAQYVDERGTPGLYHHRDYLPHIYPVPTGDVYTKLLSTYFVAAPTMMIRKRVLDALAGYDERLAYEDFDFWVRSARRYRYAYQDVCTTHIRRHAASMSVSPGRPARQTYSTYLVCTKAQAQNKTEPERQALVQRVRYELRQALLNNCRREARLFLTLLKSIRGMNPLYRSALFATRWRFTYFVLRRVLFLLKAIRANKT